MVQGVQEDVSNTAAVHHQLHRSPGRRGEACGVERDGHVRYLDLPVRPSVEVHPPPRSVLQSSTMGHQTSLP